MGIQGRNAPPPGCSAVFVTSPVPAPTRTRSQEGWLVDLGHCDPLALPCHRSRRLLSCGEPHTGLLSPWCAAEIRAAVNAFFGPRPVFILE